MKRLITFFSLIAVWATSALSQTAQSSYTFTNKYWGDATNSWTYGKAGNLFTDGRGVQITTGTTGANATTKTTLIDVSSIEVVYNTANASAGNGSIVVQVGSGSAKTFNVTPVGTSDYSASFSFSPTETGAVKLTVNCTQNSIYIKSVKITYVIFEMGGIYYSINNDGNSVSVTYKGSSYSEYSNEYNGDVVIPSSVTVSGKTYSVTSIGDSAFRDCSGLTSVTIPNSVTSIGNSAFYGCSGLTSVTIPNSVTSIGQSAFYGCRGLTSVTIPNSVTSIGDYAFSSCRGLASITIPNSVRFIGADAFNSCIGLTSVTIPNSVTSINTRTFYNCSGLTSVTIPNSVTSIGIGAFRGCSGLTSIEIPNSVTSIGNQAFYGCTNLMFATIGSSVTTIGTATFSDCPLNGLIVLCTTPPTISSISSLGSSLNVYVPAVSLAAYQSNTSWSQYNIIGIEGYGTYPNEVPTATYSGSGSGTETDPYLIFNPIQLNEVRNFLNYTDVWFKLMSNIDMTAWLADNNPSQGWMPIGNADAAFRGHFLGNNRTISGLRINRGTTDYVGFFGVTCSAEIRDLTINATEFKGKDYVGGLVGKSLSTTVDNCSVSTTVNGANYVGGLFGNATASIVSNVNVNNNVIATADYAGGIVGSATLTTISTSNINGAVNGKDYAGGLIGQAEGSSVSGTTFFGTVDGQSSTGGLVGAVLNSITTTSCEHSGAVTGTQNVGGIVGSNTDSTSTITSVKSTGNITATGSNVGGIVGFDNGSIEISGTTNKGNISGSGSVGGLVGSSLNANISESSSVGDIVATSTYCGGLIGTSATFSLNNCYSIGDVSGSGKIGGLAGYSEDTSTITDSYYNGIVAGTSDNVGGLAGSGKFALSKSYCNATVTGNNNVGGIVGNITGGSIESCVAIVDRVAAATSNAGRIYGTAASSVTIGATGTSTDNKGQATAIVSVGGLAQELPDNAQHGTNAGLSSLRLRGSYTGIGWDFTNWAILETESYPYKNDQCAPPVIYAATSGDTSISGKCLGSGVTVKIGNDTYTAPATNNSWTINLTTPLSSGQEIQAFATTADLNQSYVSRILVKYKGDGTEASPYEIYTADELQNINSYSYYKLMNDIDLTEWITENNPTGGWIPVGYNGGSFRSLDGDGHSVTGLWTNSTLANYGLISQAQDAIVKNLRVVVESGKLVKGGDCSAVAVGKAVNVEFSNIQVGGNVTGGNYIGGVAGSAFSCSFTDCASNVSLTGGNYAGLISGSGDDCDYTRCNTFGTATGNDYVGGITGNTNKTITLSHANVTATGNNYVGGLAGYADTATAINQCFSKGVISATNTTECYTGGIAGINKGSITDCYSAAEVHSGTVDGSIPTSSLKQNVGGITGYNYGNVARCYASGNLYGVKFASGIVGYNDGANAVTNNCFALNNQIQVSNEVGVVLRVIGGIRNGAPTPEANNYALKTMAVSVNNVPQIIYDDLLHGISVTLSSLLKGATYSDNGWDMTNVWDINENNGYPFLRAVEDESPIIMVLAPPTFSPEAGEYAETVTVTMSAEEGAEIRYTVDGSEPTTTSAIYSAPLTFTETTTVKAIAVKDGQISEVVSSTYTIVHQVDHLYVNDFSMKSGDSKEISIQLDNETSLIACEFYMQLPEGFSIAKDDDDYYVADLVSGRINRHTLEVEYDGNGIYHFLCYSNRNNAFVGNSGDFITLTIVANDNVAVGAYTAELKDIIFSDIDKNQVNLANNSFSIEIINVTPGDVNDDGKVNVMDIVETVSYIMGSPSASFVFAAADLDGNGTVNVMDLVNLVEMIMTSANQAAAKSSAKELMTVDCVELVNAGKNSVSVAFPGTQKFVAAQFTVELKDGNTLNDVTTDGNHRASFTEIGEGKYMVLVYSPDNRTFEGDEAIRLSVNNSKNVTVDNAVLVDVDKNAVTCNAVSSDNSCGVISIEADFSKPVDIYNLNGQLVRKNATSTKGLDKGFYIINNNKIYLR